MKVNNNVDGISMVMTCLLFVEHNHEKPKDKIFKKRIKNHVIKISVNISISRNAIIQSAKKTLNDKAVSNIQLYKTLNYKITKIRNKNNKSFEINLDIFLLFLI